MVMIVDAVTCFTRTPACPWKDSRILWIVPRAARAVVSPMLDRWRSCRVSLWAVTPEADRGYEISQGISQKLKTQLPVD